MNTLSSVLDIAQEECEKLELKLGIYLDSD